jgi:hypothetical protein
MLKNTKRLKTAHTPRSQLGMGDYYGQGVKNPIGRLRENMITNTKSGRSNKPPRKLA